MQHRRIVVLLPLLALPVIVSSLAPAPRRGGAAPPPSRARSAAAPALDPAPYAAAAAALRAGDGERAQRLLARAAAGRPRRMAEVLVLSALYAYSSGDAGQARELLAAAPEAGPFADWRLFLLAELAREEGDEAAAAAALERLLATCPDSPLRPEAYVAAARLADERGLERRALALVEAARAEGLRGSDAAALEHLAWRIGHRLDDEGVRESAARRLLVEAPLDAGHLKVADTFRAFDGSLDLAAVLSADEVKRRAHTFLDRAQLPEAALSVLDGLPERERDLEWHLLKARALTGARRGGEALALLEPLAAGERPLSARLEWERSLATASLAERGGRAERRDLLRASYRHLSRAARLAEPSPGAAADVPGSELLDLSPEALRGLAADLMDAGLFDQAVETLRILRLLDPRDATGADALWERGWRAYRNGDATTAIGTWTALAELYPEDGDAQRGAYWKARALEELGEEERALELYRELVATSDTADFYSRQALARLDGEVLPRDLRPVVEVAGPWRVDPALTRAKLLTDLGLDALALRELELVADTADARDLLALRAIVAGRQGERRSSLQMLRAAFPALGGARQASVPEEVLLAYYPLLYPETIRAEAERHRLPPSLVAGVIRQESAFDPRATSPVGARGLMQLMPGTARDMSRKLGLRYDPSRLYEPEVSVRLGTAYLRELIDRFDSVELALAGYNGGPNRIRRLWKEGQGELDAFVETLSLEESRNYVKRILVLADSYRQLYPDGAWPAGV
jgi:soluble lytic murein transglycosylase